MRCVGIAVALAVMASAAVAASPREDATQSHRFKSFVAGGYTPLSAPVDWYDTEPVEGATTVLPPVTMAATGFDGARFAKAVALAERWNSTAFIVAHRGRIVYERYWHGDARDTRFNPQSMSKTLVALLVGTAIDRGEIKSADDPIGRYIREWRRDPRGAITLRQAMQMASGLGQVDAGFGYAVVPENPAVQQHFGRDFVRPMLALPLKGPPGTRFDYNNNATNLVGLAFERATGKRYGALLSERLWKPLGLTDAALYVDRPGGFPMVSCCVFSRPIDWVAIGWVFSGRGSVDGKRIVSAAWIEAMTTPSPAYRGYGLQIWLGDSRVGGPPPTGASLVTWQAEPFEARDTVWLYGHGQQRVWVSPADDLVVVRTGREWPVGWDESALPNLVRRAIAK